MLSITYSDKEKFEYYRENGYAYKNGIYDFTFEGRFLIYHCIFVDSVVYIAFDMKTRLSSEVMRRFKRVLYTKSEYIALIPKLYAAIKYTGDKRYVSFASSDPMRAIEAIFRDILTKYGFKVREEQVRLSKNMYKAMTDKKIGICEAEVGTGKTMAYLVAAIIARTQLPQYKQSKPITIATSSIELQKSIMEKDIPFLSDVLYKYGVINEPITAVLRKGKEHYMCLNRFNRFYSSIKNHPEKYQKLINYFDRNRFAENGFDLDATTLPPSVKDRICVKGSCGNCPMKKMCQYAIFKETCSTSKKIDIQVTNHNLYLASKKINSEDILKNSYIVVIDEAHKFKDAALDIFGTKVSLKELEMFEKVIKSAVLRSNTKAKYEELLNEFDIEKRKLFERIAKYAVEDEDDDEKRVLVNLKKYDKKLIADLIEHIKSFEALKSDMPFEYRNWCSQLIEKLEMFIKTYELNVWVDNDENGNVELCAFHINIGRILHHKVWDRDVTHILTSGTMSDGENFEFFKRENGITDIVDTAILESTILSPFNFKEHTRLYIPKRLPLPIDSDEYYDEISRHVVDLVEATNGHTAILFTSYKSLMNVYERTKDKLKDYELFKMTKGKTTAINDFKNSKNGVIFASGSMWEGVDCAGDCLSSVIIVRLPFPLRSASMERKKMSCEDKISFVNEFAVPDMAIKLRQGAGRLVRTENDTGIIAILDSRANRSSYASKVHDIMQKYPLISSLEEVREFMHSVKGNDYFVN